jgi:toxin ParE1/3/4
MSASSRAIALTPRATNELREAAAWYGLHRAGLGVEFLDAFEATLDQIKQYPEGQRVSSPDVRHALFARFPYGVFYTIEAERIVVLAVLHSRRDPRRRPSRPAR